MIWHCSNCGNKGHLDTNRYCKARDEGDQHAGRESQNTVNGNPTTQAMEDSTDEEEYTSNSSDEWNSDEDYANESSAEEEDCYEDVLVVDKGDQGPDEQPSTYRK